MKKMLLAVTLSVISLTTFGQSIGVGDSVNEFRQDLENLMENTKDDMEVQISSRPLYFSDYRAASEALLNKIEDSTEKFKQDLKDVEKFLSEYDSVRNAADNRAIKRLLEKKDLELKNLRQLYKIYAQEYVMMGSHLQFPVSKRFVGLTDTGVNQAKAGIFPLLTPIVVVGLITGLTSSHKMAVIDMYKNRLRTVDAEFTRGQGRPGPRAQKWLENKLSFKANEIFSNCRSQGCIYYLAEDIALWLKKSQKIIKELNIPAEEIKAFKAKEQVSFKYIQNSLDKMADIAASGKPTSVY